MSKNQIGLGVYRLLADWNEDEFGCFYQASYRGIHGGIVTCPYQAVLSALSNHNTALGRKITKGTKMWANITERDFCIASYLGEYMDFEHGFVVTGPRYKGLPMPTKKDAIRHAIWQHNEAKAFFEEHGMAKEVEMINNDLKTLNTLRNRIEEKEE